MNCGLNAIAIIILGMAVLMNGFQISHVKDEIKQLQMEQKK